MNYWLIFLTGLTTGGLTCLALQGGLLASTLVNTSGKVARIRGISLFLIAKLIVYTIVGFILGYLGKVFAFTPQTLGFLNIFIALFMLGVAFEALKLHPIFRYFLIQPPKFLRRLIFRQEENKGDFSALALGIFTVLIPCGTTQAILALAVSGGNPIQGALTLFFFVLGTIPIFFALAYLATQLGENYKKFFARFVAVVLILLSIYTLSNGLRLLGINFTIKKPVQTENSIVVGDMQKVEIKLTNRGYLPSQIKIKQNVPVELTVLANGATTCIRVFVIPKLNYQEIVPDTEPLKFTFTPKEKGTIPFTCSMGMYHGEFIVE